MARNAAIGRRLPDVEVGVEVHLPVAELREELDARLALGHGELRPIELAKSFGTGSSFLE